MSNRVKAREWHTAKALHQIQLLSCDYVVLEEWQNRYLTAPFWRLYWHDRSGAQITIGRRTVRLNRRQFALIPPNTRLSTSNTGVFGQLFLHFIIEPGLSGPVDTIYLHEPTSEQLQIASSLKRVLREDCTNIHASFLGQILVSLSLQKIPVELWKTRFSDARITAAVASIKASYPTRLSNGNLARKAGLHPNAFIRLFRQNTGHTPVDYLTNLRLEEACLALHYSDASIEEVAEKAGFCDRAYFSRIFSARMGIAPARYRLLVNTDDKLRN